MNIEHELNQPAPMSCPLCCARTGEPHADGCTNGAAARLTMTPLLRRALEDWASSCEGAPNADAALLDLLNLMAGSACEQQRVVPDAPAASDAALTNAQIESAAKVIYESFDGASAHPWMDGGNSHKQCDARHIARKALEAAQGASTAAATSDDAHECGERTCHYFGKAAPEHCKECHAGTVPASTAAEATELSEPTDLSNRLRETADQQPGWKSLLTAAADEIERLNKRAVEDVRKAALSDGQCDAVAADTVRAVAACKGLSEIDLSTDIRENFTLRRELIRAGADAAIRSLNNKG
ncbi:hypothetical protein [Massilia antarctica]|uniref:hypothetical protein n=1 Tax=Massilia antarctica TaxID=2765360 RepID=UPI00226EE910|nr:hypothetical protein [Massilia sp. H27-R4]MCY0910911.1 hypothetical protein [Massilia sp. H27-R4]